MTTDHNRLYLQRDAVVNVMLLDMDMPPYWEWDEPDYDPSARHCQHGGYWSVGGTGSSNYHIWRLSVFHINDDAGTVENPRPSTIERHPVHDGIVFPSERAMRDYELKHDLIFPYVPRSGR